MNASLEKQISKLDLEELLEVQAAVEKLIKNFQKDRRRELQKQFKQMAAQSGFTLDEVLGGKGAVIEEPKKRNYKPKYHNPDNPEQTWTGLGMKPRWVRELLDQGKTMDDLRISE